jgi:hypothetical protein
MSLPHKAGFRVYAGVCGWLIGGLERLPLWVRLILAVLLYYYLSQRP